MLDALHLPPEGGDKNGRIQIFTSPTVETNTQWLTWRKPRGVTMIYILCIGGGGSGGNQGG